MNQLEEQLSKIIEKAIVVAEKSGEFVIEQAPDLLRQFYAWHISKSILMMAIFLAAVYLFKVISKSFGVKNEKDIPEQSLDKYVKKPNNMYYKRSYSYDDDCDGYTAFLVFNILKYFWLVGVAYWLYNLIFILVAPKLYLVEYFINK